ncbi:MAG: glutamine--scyllo-inositol aminotransferase [Paenibacillus sp.]|jgi:dTDP-4-amino-4,6-dideoxygalactose transaminase|nr:glutamine--scyllo-inositol aminotransferase [Paenibacillus sp.]
MLQQLAIHGGSKARNRPFPTRHLLGTEEKQAAMAMFDDAIATGNAFGYGGAQEQAYCREFAEFMGGGHAVTVNSGTNAVYVALRALDLEPFTEVIVSPITDAGGMMPIALLNCIPVVADAAPGKYNTDAEQIERMITPWTSAILVAHIGGEPLDVEAIVEVGRKRGIPVVEDCAQAHGATLRGRPVGSFGDIAAFSTMFSKLHCTGGQGGIVFTHNEELFGRVRQAADRGKPYGLPAGSTNPLASLNFNLSDLAAAIGREQLKKLPAIVERRRAVVARLSDRLRHLRSVSVPEQYAGAEPSYWFWRLEVNTSVLSCDKMTYCRALSAEGIPLSPIYRAMPHLMDWFQQRKVFGTSGYPWAAPEYKGDRDRQFPCPNAMETTGVQFNLSVTEAWGSVEINDTIAAFEKLERAFVKENA